MLVCYLLLLHIFCSPLSLTTTHLLQSPLPDSSPVRNISSNSCKLSDLKQHKFIILGLLRSAIQSECHWAKTKVSAWLCSFLKALGENPCYHLFQLLEAACITYSWLLVSSKSAMTGQVFLTSITRILILLPRSSTFRDPCDYIGPGEIPYFKVILLLP